MISLSLADWKAARLDFAAVLVDVIIKGMVCRSLEVSRFMKRCA
jgi:hypothetical protein